MTPASVCSSGDAKNRRPNRTKQMFEGGVSLFLNYFLFQREKKFFQMTDVKMWHLSKLRGGSGGEGVVFLNVQISAGWKKPDGGVVLRFEEIPHPPIQEGHHRSSTAEGGGGWCFNLVRGVVSPPQPPPFLAGLIFRLSWSSSSSNLCFFSSHVSWWWLFWCPDTKRRLRLPFSGGGSWPRDLAAASVSAAGGAVPVPTGPAASWSWTRSTAEQNKMLVRWNEGSAETWGETDSEWI